MVYRSAFVRISARDSARQPTTLPAELRSAHEAGQFFLTLEVAAKLRLPALADLQGQIRQRLPSNLLNDASADWRNSDGRLAAIGSPKLSLILGPWGKTEIYVQGGLGFHSNDGRGATTRVDPITGSATDAGGNPIK